MEDKDYFEDRVQHFRVKEVELLFKCALIINALALQVSWIDLARLYGNLAFHLHLYVPAWLTGITCLSFVWVSPLLGCVVFACHKKPFVTKRLKILCRLNLVAWLSGFVSLFIWSHYI